MYVCVLLFELNKHGVYRGTRGNIRCVCDLSPYSRDTQLLYVRETPFSYSYLYIYIYGVIT